MDQSALQAIEDTAQKYTDEGKSLQLRHLSKDCRVLLTNSGQLIVGSDNDPSYGVAADYKVRTGRMSGGH